MSSAQQHGAGGGLPYRPASTGPDSRSRTDKSGAPTSFGITPSQIPDHPSSTNDVLPRSSNGYGGGRSKTYGPSTTTGANGSYRQPDPYYQQQYQHLDFHDQGYYGSMTTPNLPPRDMETLKLTCEHGMREYLALCELSRKDTASMALDRTRYQRGVVLADLRSLQAELKNMIKEAENSRWRTWMTGGILATFIPFLRKIFRRGKDRESRLSSNDTEYAFRRTKKFLKILKNNVMGKGSIASVGMFVFAVLYLFQSEVTIRVAKTLQKRIKKLNARLESGDADVDDKDLKLLQGWRWRVLLW